MQTQQAAISREARRRLAQRARIEADVRANALDDDTEADILAAIEDAILDEEYEAACERAEDFELNGYPEDTPCIQSCDDWGTGEGQYHGRM